MADLDVQRKKNSPWWLWLLLALIAIALIYFLSRGCNRNANTNATSSTDTTSTITNNAATNTVAATGEWDSINFNAPNASYEEIKDKDITARVGNGYAIYSLGESILFNTGQSTIRKEAESRLKQIAESLNKRFKDGEIRIYGYTDIRGSSGYNKELAEKRAEAVRNWLVQNAGVNQNHTSLHPIGEIQSNNTEQSLQQNRRVDIVVKGK